MSSDLNSYTEDLVKLIARHVNIYKEFDPVNLAVSFSTVEHYIFRVPHLGESYTKTRTNLSNFDFTPEFDRRKISCKGQRILTHCLRYAV